MSSLSDRFKCAVRATLPVAMLAVVTACASGPVLSRNTQIQVSVNLPEGATEKNTSMLVVSGELLAATVLRDVRDSAGRVVIAAGTQVEVRATAIPDSTKVNGYRAVVALGGIPIGDRTYRYAGPNVDVDWGAGLAVRPTTQDQVAGGAVEGAILGHVLGGQAVVGGMVGAAAVGDTQTDLAVWVPCNEALTIPVSEGLPDVPLKPNPKQVSRARG